MIDGRSLPFGLLLRALLLFPPLALTGAAIKLILSAPWNWSSDTPPLRTLPYWVSSLSPFIVACLPLGFGLGMLATVLSRTNGRFRIDPRICVTGFIAIGFTSLVLVGLSGRAAYGRFQYPTEFGGGNPVMSLAITSVTSAFFLGSASAIAYLYGKSMLPERGRRFERRKDEPDGTGVLIKRMLAARNRQADRA